MKPCLVLYLTFIVCIHTKMHTRSSMKIDDIEERKYGWFIFRHVKIIFTKNSHEFHFQVFV